MQTASKLTKLESNKVFSNSKSVSRFFLRGARKVCSENSQTQGQSQG